MEIAPGGGILHRSLVAALLLLLPAEAAAQEAPFSRVRVRAALGDADLDGTTGAHWEVRREWGAEVAGAFHGGWLAFQVDRTGFEGTSPERPRVTGTHLLVGWTRDVSLPLGFRAGAGGLLGGLWMEDDEGRMGEPEAEMTVAGQLAVSGPRLLGSLRPWARARVRRVFFAHPLDLLSASAGLAWEAPLPDALARSLGGEGAAPERADPERAAREGAAATAGSGAGAAEEERWSTTLTRADLDRAGATRMADLVPLLPGWRSASVDHYAWRLLPPGGGLFDDPHPKVLVDGVPVPVEVLGVGGLEHLPISLSDVETVRVVEGPLLEAGEPIHGGLLRFRTRRARGLEAGAGHQEGNAARDPGLLGLTPLATANVERIGRYTTWGAGVGGERVHGRVSGANLTLYHTDDSEGRRMDRTGAPVDGDPYIQTLRTGAAGGVEGATGRARFVAGTTRTNDYFLLPAVGTEVLTRNDRDFAGAAGRLALPAGGALRARAALSRRTLRAHDFDPRPGFGFRARSLEAAAAWSPGEGESGALGLHYDARRMAEGAGFPARTIRRGRLFGHLALPAGVGLDASLSRVGGAWGGAASALRPWRLGSATRVTVRAAYSVEPFAASDGFAAWWIRGYRPPLRPDLVLEVPGAEGPPAPGARRTGTAEVRGSTTWPGRALRLEGGLGIRRDAGLTLLAPRYRVEDGIPRTTSGDTVALRTGERGSGVRAWARVDGAAGEAWGWSLAASRHAVLGGTAAFREARDQVPAGQVSASLLWTGLPDLSVRASVRRTGPARWAAYDVDGSEAGGGVPGRTRVDVAVQKWMWEGRLRGVVVVRDLLDQDRPLHPIGITPGMRMEVRGEARLGRR